jgi:phosphoserine phosphatase RsbU/P
MTEQAGRLLIVDDDEIIRTMLARYLRMKGHSVCEAADGETGLAVLARDSFDLVVLDSVMPGQSGLEVLTVIRTTHSPTDLPVIMATARGESSAVVEALQTGASDYLIKPFDFSVALARVETQLSLKRSVDRIAGLEQSLARRHAELAEANRLMKGDLEAAARVQRALLPVWPLDIPGVRFAWHYQPCDELAGDLLNVVPLGDRHVALYVLDVVGHGVKASLMAVMVSSVIAQMLARPGHGQGAGPPVSPGHIVAALNQAFPWDERMGQFCTLLFGILDLVTGKFDFVSAAHPGPIHLPRAGRGRVLGAKGLPVGLGVGSYHVHSLSLEAGDRVYLYSDGLCDAKDENGDRLGKEGLLRAIEQERALPLEDGVAALMQRFEQWCGSVRPDDDVSLLAFEFVPALRKQFPTPSDTRRLLVTERRE